MSIPVSLDELRAALTERGDAGYLLTVSDDARPHAVHVAVQWRDDALEIDVGSRTAVNAAARPAVSLLCPVRYAGDYSLIIDGTAVLVAGVGGQRVLVRPTKAVLHRPATTPKPAAPCSADCVPLFPTSKTPNER
jgi:hypothetical protein